MFGYIQGLCCNGTYFLASKLKKDQDNFSDKGFEKNKAIC